MRVYIWAYILVAIRVVDDDQVFGGVGITQDELMRALTRFSFKCYI